MKPNTPKTTPHRRSRIHWPALLPALLAAMPVSPARAQALRQPQAPLDSPAIRIGDQAMPTLPTTPTGNAVPTLSTLSVQGTSNPSVARQFMVNLGMVSNAGSGCTNGPQCGNVLLYGGMVQQPGSHDAWTANLLFTAEAGVDRYGQAMEIDVNNARGDTPLGRGNFVGGITLTGTNTRANYLNRQAILVSSGSPNPLWHVGLLGDGNGSGGGSVQEALIYDPGSRGLYSYWNQSPHAGAFIFDQGASPVGAALSGTYVRAAVSTENATTPVALAAKPGQTVCWAGTDACVAHTGGKLVYSVGGTAMFSVSDTGDATFRGKVTQGGTP